MKTRIRAHTRSLLVFGMAVICSAIACRTETRVKGKRVVSLSPAMTETIFALGAQEYLVGVTTYCSYPAEAKAIEKVGDFSNPSLERILGLKPDLVIVNTPEQRRIQQQLEQLGIDVYESSPQTMEEIYAEIAEIGVRLNARAEAESIIAYMKDRLQPDTGSMKRVYVELSPRPLITIGSGTFLNELLKRAGGDNIFSDSKKDYPVVSAEAVILRDPEIIIVLHPEPFGERIGWKNVTAVKNQEVFADIDQDLLMRPGPRLVMGYQALRDIISD